MKLNRCEATVVTQKAEACEPATKPAAKAAPRQSGAWKPMTQAGAAKASQIDSLSANFVETVPTAVELAASRASQIDSLSANVKTPAPAAPATLASK